MTDNRIINAMRSHFELEAQHDRIWDEWIADCNARSASYASLYCVQCGEFKEIKVI